MGGQRLRAWAVSTGSYSSYRVLAVFTYKRDAEAAVEMANENESDRFRTYRVEPIAWYPKGSRAQLVTAYGMSQDLWDDGTAGDFKINHRTEPEFDHLHGPPPERPKVKFVRSPGHQGLGGRLEVYGSDLQAVTQAFNDRKMQWKAERT
jgi:hypothetical protein